MVLARNDKPSAAELRAMRQQEYQLSPDRVWPCDCCGFAVKLSTGDWTAKKRGGWWYAFIKCPNDCIKCRKYYNSYGGHDPRCNGGVWFELGLSIPV
jgi:hypothetical protein